MNKIMLLIAIVSFALPSFARTQRNQRDNRVTAKAHPYNTAVKALEDLYAIPYQRSVDLSCYASKPNTLERIFRTKSYKQHRNRKLNSDLCDIEFDRIDAAADNIDFLSRARFRNAQAVVKYLSLIHI